MYIVLQTRSRDTGLPWVDEVFRLAALFVLELLLVAVLKTYRQPDDECIDHNSRKAADVLELASNDYEVAGERSVLLLRMCFPPGLPAAARDML